ncbi:MAG: hypothetical protein KO202_05315 [Methanobacteriaceae archaeon]|jgi:hypothetical protein|nr:hypothetical protein [Methanobacteriaceae archaeon]
MNQRNEDYTDGIYKDYEDSNKFKGYLILACDGSIINLPNTKINKERIQCSEKYYFKKIDYHMQESLVLLIQNRFHTKLPK